MTPMFRKFSISTKIIIISTILAAVFLGASFSYLVSQIRQELVHKTIESFHAHIDAERKAIEIRLMGIRETLVTLSGTPPLQGMNRALVNDGFDKQGASSYDQWRDRLSNIFESEMRASDLFAQLRYIDVTGFERVRVNYENGSSVRVSEDGLQNKSDRSYIQDSQDLLPNEIYVSNIELNREGTDQHLSYPHLPVLRYVIPVFNEQTELRSGSVVGNISFESILEDTLHAEQDQSEIFVIDYRGYYINHPDPAREWGGPNDLKTGDNFFKDYPDLRDVFEENVDGSFETNDAVFVFARISPHSADPSLYWFIIQEVPKQILFNSTDVLTQRSLFVGFGVFIILFFVFAFFIRKLLKPLNRLVNVAQKVGEGDFNQHIEQVSRDEIGVLANAFNIMTGNLGELYADLESKVEQKTKELESKVDELESTKKAVINVLDDVDEARRHAEVEEEKTSAMLSSIGDGLVVVNENGEIILVNNVFQDLLGWTDQEVRGKRLTEIIPLIDEKNQIFPEEKRLISLTLKQQEKVSNRTQSMYYQRKDTSRFPVAISVSPIIVAGKLIGAVEVFRDITKEKEIDKAKTEFVSLASHQLRTPLTAIRWYVELLLSDDSKSLTDEQREYLKEVADGNLRMIDLVNALLNVSRIELGSFAVDVEPVAIEPLCDAVIKDLQPLIDKKHHTVDIDCSSAPNSYSADPKLMMIILQNLVSNAVKYTPEKGTIRVRVNYDHNTLNIVVSDNGYGIPKDQQDKVFDKLFRADNVKIQDTTGTGLGLYIVKAIVEQSQGEIWFDSEQDKGTTFNIKLPITGMKPKEGAKPLE